MSPMGRDGAGGGGHKGKDGFCCIKVVGRRDKVFYFTVTIFTSFFFLFFFFEFSHLFFIPCSLLQTVKKTKYLKKTKN